MARPKKGSQKISTEQRRKEITILANQLGGIFKLIPKQLSEKYKVHLSVIYDDIQIIIQKIPKQQADIISYNIMQNYEKGIGILTEVLEDPKIKQKDKTHIIKTMFDGQEKYTKVLEAWGLKEKIAEKMEHDVKAPINVYFERYKPDKETKVETVKREMAEDTKTDLPV